MEVSAAGPGSCSSLEMLDHHLQALRSMPVNLSLNNSASAEHQASKYGSPCPTGHSRRGDGKGGGGVPLVKTESDLSARVACSGGAYQEEQREPTRMAYEQGHCDFPLAGFLKNEQRSPPDSTDEGAAGEVGRLELWDWGFSPSINRTSLHFSSLFLSRSITSVPPQELVISSTAPQCKLTTDRRTHTHTHTLLMFCCVFRHQGNWSFKI